MEGGEFHGSLGEMLFWETKISIKMKPSKTGPQKSQDKIKGQPYSSSDIN